MRPRSTQSFPFFSKKPPPSAYAVDFREENRKEGPSARGLSYQRRHIRNRTASGDYRRRRSTLAFDALERKTFDELLESECVDGPPPKGRCARLIFRIRTLPNRILFRVARQDTRAIKQSLRLFPLSFKEPDMENRFIQTRCGSDYLQTWTVGLLYTALVCLFWIAYTVALLSYPEVSRSYFITVFEVKCMKRITLLSSHL